MFKQVEFASEKRNISIAENLVDEVAEYCSLSKEVYGNMLVTIIEAVANAIMHGNRSNPALKVFVSCKVNPDHVVFIVRDQGPGFDYSHVPDPTTSENIEKPNGRGVFLMRKLADYVDFEDGGSTLMIQFKR